MALTNEELQDILSRLSEEEPICTGTDRQEQSRERRTGF